MSTVQSYRDLKVWQESMRLVESTYLLTRMLPKEERYGLVSQIQRAAVSIPANISEGHARQSTKEYCHHLSIARGSLAELETELQIAVQIKYLTRDQIRAVWKSCQETGRMLTGLIRTLTNGPIHRPSRSANP